MDRGPDTISEGTLSEKSREEVVVDEMTMSADEEEA